MPPINHDDIREFIAIGLAGICALAWCGWQYEQIRLAMEVRKTKDDRN